MFNRHDRYAYLKDVSPACPHNGRDASRNYFRISGLSRPPRDGILSG
ncbi:hypothetical protein [Eleftheria terrae]|nr:hypothetical protein [Eleftheria terrae]WKB55771.1 hypothetical protein N7L95_27150 [Eleftheria terrae]